MSFRLIYSLTLPHSLKVTVKIPFIHMLLRQIQSDVKSILTAYFAFLNRPATFQGLLSAQEA